MKVETSSNLSYENKEIYDDIDENTQKITLSSTDGGSAIASSTGAGTWTVVPNLIISKVEEGGVLTVSKLSGLTVNSTFYPTVVAKTFTATATELNGIVTVSSVVGLVIGQPVKFTKNDNFRSCF